MSDPQARRHTPVLVAGGGPAGLSTAAELAHHGMSCLLVEPRRTVSANRPRAKTTSVRTMEHFRRWGMADAVRTIAPLMPSWSDSVIFCDALLGRELTRFTECFGLSAMPDDRFAEGGQQVPQPLVEQVLRGHVAQQPTVETMFGAAVAELTEHDDHVTVVVRDEDGTELVVDADYVVACDGAQGVVRRALGIRYEGRSDQRTNFNVVFRAPDLRTPLDRAVQYWVVGERTSGLLGHLDLDGTWWAIAPGIDAEFGSRHTASILADLVGRPVEHEVVSTDPWTARMLVAERFATNRVFLVGEAAHLNPPWGGHGYNTCVGDAVNVGWKLAAVLHGWAGPALLASYEAERRPIAVQTIASAETNMGTLSTDLAARADLADDAALAAAIQAGKRAEFHSLGLVLGYSYAGSPVVQPGLAPPARSSPEPQDAGTYVPTAAPGARLPHTWLAPGESLYDCLGTGMTVLGPLASAHEQVAGLRDHAAALGIPLEVVDAPPGYGWVNDFLLVRPDQHVAGRAASPLDLDLAAAVGRHAGEPKHR